MELNSPNKLRNPDVTTALSGNILITYSAIFTRATSETDIIMICTVQNKVNYTTKQFSKSDQYTSYFKYSNKYGT